MIGIVFNALFSSFFMVRVTKGPWLRNPQYLATALVGSVAGLLILHAFSPGAEDQLIAGNLAALGGAWGGVFLFDRVLGTA